MSVGTDTMMVTGHKQGYTSDCGLGPIQKLEQINIETVELQQDPLFVSGCPTNELQNMNLYDPKRA